MNTYSQLTDRLSDRIVRRCGQVETLVARTANRLPERIQTVPGVASPLLARWSDLLAANYASTQKVLAAQARLTKSLLATFVVALPEAPVAPVAKISRKR